MASANLVMVWALLTHDFSVSYVAQVGSRAVPTWVSFVSLWSSLEGSILFWGLVLGVYVAVATWANRNSHPEYMPYATAVWLACAAFFSFLLAGPAQPFQTMSPIPTDGPGPNPLLQNHVLMAIHPPFLYSGYVGMTIPFGLACAALLTGHLGHGFIRPLRTWLLVPWVFLTCAIVLGGWWAYEVLGWGGYWAWDPVENASLLPWLTATAARALGAADGAQGDPQGMDRDARRRLLPPDDPRHVHDPLGGLQLGPLLHPERHRPDDPGVPDRGTPLLGRSPGAPGRYAGARRAPRGRAEPRRRLPPEQPALRPAHVHRPRGHRLPAGRRGPARGADERGPALLRRDGRAHRGGAPVPDGRGPGPPLGTGHAGADAARPASPTRRRGVGRGRRLRAGSPQPVDGRDARLRRLHRVGHARRGGAPPAAADAGPRRGAARSLRRGEPPARAASLRRLRRPRRRDHRHRGDRGQQHDGRPRRR